MIEERPPQVSDEARIQAVVKKARQRDYRLHRALNIPVAVMIDGKVVRKVPDEADIEAGRIV